MKRGFMLTAITTILFLVLIEMTLEYARSSSSYSQRVSEMLVSEKVGYTFDDIMDDITNITGLSITQQEANLIFKDSFPGSGITNRLGYYEQFMRERYLTPDLEAIFLNPEDQQIALTDLSSTIVVEPFNMTYKYSDFAKTDLFIQIPYTQSAAIDFVWYNISVPTGNFSDDVDDIKWTPAPKSCTPGTPGCIRFYLKVNDTGGHEYISPYTTFDVTKQGHLNLNFVNESCWIDLWVGPYSGEEYLLNLRMQDCQVRSEIGFTFNTTNFWLNFPTKLKVRDVNYNTSKKDRINLIMTKLLK